MPGEFGQIASYATRIKMVGADGELFEVSEDDPELLLLARSSYGLFGVVYEVTFRVRELAPMAVYHETYKLEQFTRILPTLWARNESMMWYIDPFIDRITVEYRVYGDEPPPAKPKRSRWRIRNFVWKQFSPGFCYFVRKYVPSRRLRAFAYGLLSRLEHLALRRIVSQRDSIATDQMIRYPELGGRSAYWFSIWAFPEDRYTQLLPEYFDFIKDYYRRTGFRCDLVNVGYRISADQSSLFSYSYDGPVMTIDPVATGGPGWEEFLVNYNEWCSERGGVPLFNQSKSLARHQVAQAFGDRVSRFNEARERFDPAGRLLNTYFRELIA
jgi:FAD/FMN-containing dehydrogenase